MSNRVEWLIDEIDRRLGMGQDVEDLTGELASWSNCLEFAYQGRTGKVFQQDSAEIGLPSVRRFEVLAGADDSTLACKDSLAIGADEYNLVRVSDSPVTFRVEDLSALDMASSLREDDSIWRIVLGEVVHQLKPSELAMCRSSESQPVPGGVVHRLAAKTKDQREESQAAGSERRSLVARYSSQTLSFTVHTDKSAQVFIVLE